jgi:nitrate/TMAO reductase-like tetraheme cytochrome c subunit
VNKVSTARAMLIVAFFGAGALSVHATSSSCVDCHSNQAIMQKLVSPPVVSEAEGEG